MKELIMVLLKPVIKLVLINGINKLKNLIILQLQKVPAPIVASLLVAKLLQKTMQSIWIQ